MTTPTNHGAPSEAADTATRHGITIMIVVMGLSFLFGFGNGRSLTQGCDLRRQRMEIPPGRL
jgi:hypothetical protein